MAVIGVKSITGITSITNAASASDVLTFHSNNTTERVRIDSTGRLLIGRTSTYASSSEKLSVNGLTSIQYASSSSAGLYIFNTETTGGTTVQPFLFFHDGGGNRGGFGVQRSTSNLIINGQTDIQFRTGASGVSGTERLRITSGGKVSIGDAATHTYSAHSEGDDLVVGGSGWRGITIYGTNGGVIQFADASGNREGQIMYNHGNDSMMFRTAGNVDRLLITSNGLVHTGMTGTVPSWLALSTIVTREKFSVFQGANFAEACFNIDVDNGQSFLSHNLYYNSGWKTKKTSNPSLQLEMGGNGFRFLFGTDGGNDGASTLSEKLRINSTGHVAIGAVPATGLGLFSIKPNPSVDAFFKVRPSNDFDGSSTGAVIDCRNSANNASKDFIIRSKTMRFWMGDTGGEKMRMQHGGNHTLQVKGAQFGEGYGCDTWTASMYFGSGATHTICTMTNGSTDSTVIATIDYCALYSYASNNRYGGRIMSIARKTSSGSSAEANNNIDGGQSGNDSNIKPTFFWDVSDAANVKLKLTTGGSVQVMGRIHVTFRETWTLTRNYSAE